MYNNSMNKRHARIKPWIQNHGIVHEDNPCFFLNKCYCCNTILQRNDYKEYIYINNNNYHIGNFIFCQGCYFGNHFDMDIIELPIQASILKTKLNPTLNSYIVFDRLSGITYE